MFYPYLLFLLCFIYYTVIIFEKFHEKDKEKSSAADGTDILLNKINVPSIDDLKDP